MAEIRLVIADDHTLMRSGLKLLLANQPDITVVGEAADGIEAYRLVQELRPDIVLLDVSMPELNGLDCMKRIREFDASIKVILLTMHEDTRYLKEGFAAGAAGYVLKKAADDVLFEAIRTVQAGQVFVQNSMAQSLVCEIKEQRKQPLSDFKPLSEQEKRVLSLIALGHSNAEIAETLVVSIRTVETYKYRIMEKLNTRKRADLVKYAIEQGLVVK